MPVRAESLRQYMAAHGISVPSSLHTGSDGGKWFDVRDPEDNKVEFVQAPAAPPEAPLDSLSHHIIHVGYMVHSRAAEDAFFRTVLGFRPYWYGGFSDTVVAWVSQQVPDGRRRLSVNSTKSLGGSETSKRQQDARRTVESRT